MDTLPKVELHLHLARNLNAVEASFAPPELKASLARRLRAAYYYSRTS